jgi:hypothetical protein
MATTPGSLTLRDDGFQIFAGNNHGAVFGLVHAIDERDQVVVEGALAGLIEGSKGLQGRTIIVPEYLHKMLGRAISEFEIARRGHEVGRGAEQFIQARL